MIFKPATILDCESLVEKFIISVQKIGPTWKRVLGQSSLGLRGTVGTDITDIYTLLLQVLWWCGVQRAAAGRVCAAGAGGGAGDALPQAPAELSDLSSAPLCPGGALVPCSGQ